MYGEFENWQNVYGKDIEVGKSNKTLHLVLARQTTNDDNQPTKTVEAECDGSEEEEEEGYDSERGQDLLSRRGQGRKGRGKIITMEVMWNKLMRERWVTKTVKTTTLNRVKMRENGKIGDNKM